MGKNPPAPYLPTMTDNGPRTKVLIFGEERTHAGLVHLALCHQQGTRTSIFLMSVHSTDP